MILRQESDIFALLLIARPASVDNLFRSFVHSGNPNVEGT